MDEQRDGATNETWGSIGEVARRVIEDLKKAGAEAPAVREETPKEGNARTGWRSSPNLGGARRRE